MTRDATRGGALAPECCALRLRSVLRSARRLLAHAAHCAALRRCNNVDTQVTTLSTMSGSGRAYTEGVLGQGMIGRGK